MEEAKLEAGKTRLLPHHDMVVEFKNPFASDKLIVPLVLTANVDDETLERNIRTNSARKNEWLSQVPVHDGVAIVVGSGPSARDHVERIKTWQSEKGTVFALNNAASWLFRNGVVPEWQVIADARPETLSLIGVADRHLFASQVDPSLFDEEPEAMLFHADYGGVLDLLPEHPEEFVMVGSHSSVGNTSLALAYALGFRHIVCVGFDSSYTQDGRSHVLHQPMNDGEPTIVTEFNGKVYLSSLTMRQQADIFPRLANRLIAEGCKVEVIGSGLLPDRWKAQEQMPLEDRERAKYEKMWTKESYRTWSPALEHVVSAVLSLDMEPGQSLFDFGCGSGLASSLLADHGMKVTGIDIANNCLSVSATGFAFMQACLWELPVMEAENGLCCDVMEHIPTERVDAVLDNIARSVRNGCYFTIDSQEDALGAEIGDVLHLTVKPRVWWIEKLQQRFAVVQIAEPNVYVCWKHEQPAITPDSEKE